MTPWRKSLLSIIIAFHNTTSLPTRVGDCSEDQCGNNFLNSCIAFGVEGYSLDIGIALVDEHQKDAHSHEHTPHGCDLDYIPIERQPTLYQGRRQP